MLPKIFESEFRFCLILWENEPVTTHDLINICHEKLGWNKSTTYTVIRRLSERGVLANNDSVITSLVSKEQIQEARMSEMIESTFCGSMPSFIAAFSRIQNLKEHDIKEIMELINSQRK